jgi:hypothetical protein
MRSVNVQAVEISPAILSMAEQSAHIFSRSISNQIEHWARIGKTAEENPDLPYSFIKDTLRGLEEAQAGDISPYPFGPND